MRRTRTPLALVLIGLSLGAVACGAKPAAAPTAPTAPADGFVPVGEAKVGDKSRCTVSGEEIVVEETSPRSEYQGKTYYFCCSGCKKRFDADPAKYLGKKG